MNTLQTDFGDYRVKPIHGAPNNPTIESLKKHYRGYTETPPKGCNLKVGDRVHYTNPQGVEFELTVKGFTATCEKEDNGRTVYIFDDCYWFPVKPEACKCIGDPRVKVRSR